MSRPHGRHELKHYINYADVIELRSSPPFVAGHDKNSIEGNGYRIKSLYFDNYNDKALMEKINGTDRREKFRLRMYNGDASFIRLEKKSKIHGLCFKESAVISKEECQKLLASDYSVLKQNGDPLCMELYVKIGCQQLRPKSIVDYMREAYVYLPGNVRVTLDHDIRTSQNIHEFLSSYLVLIPISGIHILEVKYDSFLPEIIRGLATLSDRRCTTFSKYAAARLV